MNTEATSSKRLDRHDPQTILNCLTSLWAVHLHRFRWMNCSRRGFLRGGRSSSIHRSHLQHGGKTTWLPKCTRKLHTSCKDWRYPKTEYQQNAGQQRVQISAPTEEKVPFLSLFLGLKGSRAGGIPNSRCSRATLEVRREENFRWTQVRSIRNMRVVDSRQEKLQDFT